MKSSAFRVVVLVVLLAALAAVFWKFYLEPQQPAPVAEQAPLEKHAVPAIRNPLPPGEGGDQEKPLPDLKESDLAMREVLASLFGGGSLDSLWNFDHFIERFVLLVDSLPKRQLPRNRLLAKPVRGKFMAMGEEGKEVIDPANYRRYDPYVRSAEALDAKQLVTVYIHFYPLFQKAYEQLGYPSVYFNDRLVEVIDHLLAAPEVRDPVGLVRPVVHYEFADPDLESLSAGQRILLRMGNANAMKVKAKLREIRRELILREGQG